MGITISRQGSSTVTALPTPEQEAKAKANHATLENMPSPVIHGSPKQIQWANSIVTTFLFYAHQRGFKAEDIAEFFKTDRAKYAKFWIDNRNLSPMSGETGIAVENAIAEQKRCKQLARRF